MCLYKSLKLGHKNLNCFYFIPKEYNIWRVLTVLCGFTLSCGRSTLVLGLTNKFCNYRNIHWLSVIPCLCYLLRIFKCTGVILDRFSHNEFSLIRMNCSTFFIINRTLWFFQVGIRALKGKHLSFIDIW